MLIATACFIGVLSLFLGAYWVFVLRPETDAQRALSRRLNPTRTISRILQTSLLNDLAPASSLPVLERVLVRFARSLRPLAHLI